MSNQKKRMKRWINKRYKRQQSQRIDHCFRNIFVKRGIIKNKGEHHQ